MVVAFYMFLGRVHHAGKVVTTGTKNCIGG